MTIKTIDLKKQKSIRLPQAWQGEAFVMQDNSTIIVSNAKTLSFDTIRQRIKDAKIRITPREIQKEIDAYRREKYAGSS